MKEDFGANFFYTLFNPKIIILTLVIAFVKIPYLKVLLSKGYVYPRLKRSTLGSLFGLDEMYYMFINVVLFSFILSMINLSIFCKKRRDEKKPITLFDGDIWLYLFKTLPIPILVFALMYGFLSSPMVESVPVIGQGLLIAQSFGLIGLLLAGFIFYFTFTGQYTLHC